MTNNRKGMSQILSLIIGAAVIMMVAMILIMSATDIIGGGTADAEMDTCRGIIESQCQVRSSFSTPGSCSGLDPDVVEQGLDNEISVDPQGDVECN